MRAWLASMSIIQNRGRLWGVALMLIGLSSCATRNQAPPEPPLSLVGTSFEYANCPGQSDYLNAQMARHRKLGDVKIDDNLTEAMVTAKWGQPAVLFGSDD